MSMWLLHVLLRTSSSSTRPESSSAVVLLLAWGLGVAYNMWRRREKTI
jgi:hypothetical protein